MITGKYGALKGFSLFFYAILTLLNLICTCTYGGGMWCVIGILNAIVNSTIIVLLYKYWSN